jgi:hypothetical protein
MAPTSQKIDAPPAPAAPAAPATRVSHANPVLIFFLTIYAIITLTVWVHLAWDEFHINGQRNRDKKPQTKQPEEEMTNLTPNEPADNAQEEPAITFISHEDAAAKVRDEPKLEEKKEDGCPDGFPFCRPAMPVRAQHDCFFRAVWFLGVLLYAACWPLLVAMIALLLAIMPFVFMLKCLVGDATTCCGLPCSCCGRAKAGYQKTAADDEGGDDAKAGNDEADLEAGEGQRLMDEEENAHIGQSVDLPSVEAASRAGSAGYQVLSRQPSMDDTPPPAYMEN